MLEQINTQLFVTYKMIDDLNLTVVAFLLQLFLKMSTFPTQPSASVHKLDVATCSVYLAHSSSPLRVSWWVHFLWCCWNPAYFPQNPLRWTYRSFKFGSFMSVFYDNNGTEKLMLYWFMNVMKCSIWLLNNTKWRAPLQESDLLSIDRYYSLVIVFHVTFSFD